MKTDEIVQIFEDMGADAYDGFNSHFRQLSESMYFLTMLALKDLPRDANILCVGVGTGADIIDLAKTNPGWTFTGVEPSKSMLDGCRMKLKIEGLTNRCELFHGYLSDFSSKYKYDAVLCYFVMHFIEKVERKKIYYDINKHLKNEGYFVHAEISCDFETDDFHLHLKNWKSLHGYSGATEEKLSSIEEVLTKQLYILSPTETKKLVQECGFKNHIQFFQSFMIHAWHTRKSP